MCDHAEKEVVGEKSGRIIEWCPECGTLIISTHSGVMDINRTPKNNQYGAYPESEEDAFGNFGKNPEHYININNGDAFIIWWKVNRPFGDGWIRVSKECFKIHTRPLGSVLS